MDKIRKYHKSINYFFWCFFFISIFIIGAYWIYKIVEIHQTKIELANNTYFPPFCGNALVDPILAIFNFIIPFTFGSLIFLYLNTYLNKGKYFSVSLATVLSLIILIALLRELAEISLLFSGQPLFTCIWWWPFGEI